MTTGIIESLYKEFRTVTEYTPDYTFDFFKRKENIFHSALTFTNERELRLYTELTYQYLHALYLVGRYNDAADMALKHLSIIDSETNRLDPTAAKDEWYYGVKSFYAMATYKLRDYNASTKAFRQLVDYNPKNENYKLWLSSSLYGQRIWISKTITIVCGLILLIEIFAKQYITSYEIRMTINGIALSGIIGTVIYDFYAKRSYRVTNKRTNLGSS